MALKGSPQEYDILCLWQPRDKHLRSGPFLRHTSPFTALQHDAHLHINSHQPPSSLYSHIRKTHKQAHKKADARTSLYSCARTLAQTHAQTATDLLKMLHTCGQTHTCAHNTHRWFKRNINFKKMFFFLRSALFIYRSLLCLEKKKTFTCFVIRPGHMPSQAPHTSLIMQMRGNVTPQQQMARDDNNGSTDQFQCLRLYRYGNNKNRWYEILVC